MSTPSHTSYSLAGTAVLAWLALSAAAQAATFTDVGAHEAIGVPQSGIYRVVVAGARGGGDGGVGALVQGDLFMMSGTSFSVLVGGDGVDYGGGGASMFTYAGSREAMGAERAIAGGGGGGGGDGSSGGPGFAETLGGGGGGRSPEVYYASAGAGGGGLFGFGEDGGPSGGAPLAGSAAGGLPGGGFGGGGGGDRVRQSFRIVIYQYGGGGGYTGGDGGYFIDAPGPDEPAKTSTGGSSFLSPTLANQIRITGGATDGARVSVDLVAPIPVPGALGLMGSAVACLALVVRRRTVRA
jgi:hypothetical protein